MNKYTVALARLFDLEDKEYPCYFILKDLLPEFLINKWLESKGKRSLQTSRQYAYNLCGFLNYLVEINKTYEDATKVDVVNYIDSLLFCEVDGVFKINSNISYNTAYSYLITIKVFYKHLEDNLNKDANISNDKRQKRSAKYSYLYGQIWDMNINDFLAEKVSRIKGTKNYIKWYSEEEKTAIESKFNTLRDKAIFLLTLEGMRIDEVISLTLNSYDSVERTINTNRSKGSKARIIPIKKATAKMIDDYLYTERNEVECQLGIINDYMFINLRKGKDQGQVVSYRNTLDIIKRAGDKAGIDTSEMRSHSGRSTRTMELLRI
ncbi:tyrosine-type recombinase/integrase [Anaerocolumna sp.]|uniref:tyrosine-type recombinase/integrase n=1 Tax=Anaerocolumna sp. TaxID=2041569 RepID=UPI0028AD9E44|nr:tyrosine-type recombinase/integrase [Anaerocolumna sp.]